MEASLVTHLSQLQCSYDEKLKAQQTLMEKSLDQAQRQVAALKETINAQRKTEHIAEWKVKDFSNIKRRCFKRSKAFSILNFDWFMGSYFFGDNEDSQDFLSIYLFCQTAPVGCKITLKYSITVVNNLSEEDSVSKDFVITFPVSSGQGWGDRKAILHSTINNTPGFLDAEGSLTVVCCAQVMTLETAV